MKWEQLCSNLNILWHCSFWGLEWKLTFPVMWPLLSFPNFLDIECSTFIASSFRIWNSSTGIPSPPTASFILMLPKAQVRALGWEDPLEKEMAIHSSTIAWKIPWTEEPGRPQSMGSQRVGHDWATELNWTWTFFGIAFLWDWNENWRFPGLWPLLSFPN